MYLVVLKWLDIVHGRCNQRVLLAIVGSAQCIVAYRYAVMDGVRIQATLSLSSSCVMVRRCRPSARKPPGSLGV